MGAHSATVQVVLADGAEVKKRKPGRKEILHSIAGMNVPPEWYFSLSPALGTFY